MACNAKVHTRIYRQPSAKNPPGQNCIRPGVGSRACAACVRGPRQGGVGVGGVPCPKGNCPPRVRWGGNAHGGVRPPRNRGHGTNAQLQSHPSVCNCQNPEPVMGGVNKTARQNVKKVEWNSVKGRGLQVAGLVARMHKLCPRKGLGWAGIAGRPRT